MSELDELQKIFKTGVKVKHVRGGLGEVRTLENDWSTSPPTVVAVVRVLGTALKDLRRIPVSDLRLDENMED